MVARISFRRTLLGMLLLVLTVSAKDEPTVAANKGPMVEVRLVTDLESNTLVSDVERIEAVEQTLFSPHGEKTIVIGHRATLWVRNAHVDGRYFFERFYQGKYIDRRSAVSIPLADLAVGVHRIEPGDHRFVVHDDGTLSSEDPNIRINGHTLSLQLHPVVLAGVDGAQHGPNHSRYVSAAVSLFDLLDDVQLNAGALPDPKQLINPQAKGKQPPKASLTNVLSHNHVYRPLTVYLPANTVGQGYVSYPSWQAFHVSATGEVVLSGGGAPAVPGVTSAANEITVPYRRFSGHVESTTSLRGGVGSVYLANEMNFSPTLEQVVFSAGVGAPPKDFFLPVSTDFSQLPYKFFLADNMSKDPAAIRLLALEWEQPVLLRNQESTMSLRFLDTPAKTTVENPIASVQWSPFDPKNPAKRAWQPVTVRSWQNAKESGPLTFQVPDVSFQFVVIRVSVHAQGSQATYSPLNGEFAACIVEPAQQGMAAMVSNKGRNAFVAGEDIRLHASLRSQARRPAGEFEVVLKAPDGREERLSLRDDGSPTLYLPIVLSARSTRNWLPGRYSLEFSKLPKGIVPWPFGFDLVEPSPKSEFMITKPSKYTHTMNGLVPSHSRGRGGASMTGSHSAVPTSRIDNRTVNFGLPYDIDRAVSTLGELGYNRIDHMAYVANFHVRPFQWLEQMAAADSRLMVPEAVYWPSPRDQILNAAVRERIAFSDVLVSFNDFHVPRYIDGYINASRRWISREMTAMRHSPALTGMFIFDECYDFAVVGFPDQHQFMFKKIREARVVDVLGKTPAEINARFARYLKRPPSQRDPDALAEFIRYRKYQVHGWRDYNARVAAAAREVKPDALIGAYEYTSCSRPGEATAIDRGYGPDMFDPLDIAGHMHYSDNITGATHSSIMVPYLRKTPGRKVLVNIPLTHEYRALADGQYQRHMAFAMLAQAADGVSMYGMLHDFRDGLNREMMLAKETTRHLNQHILAPFGDVFRRCQAGYRKVAIVTTLAQHVLHEQKPLPYTSQLEGVWLACWRLGYPAVFLREPDFEQPLQGHDVIFVPGVRFDGELPEHILARLQAAIRAGSKVVVEKGSTLALDGVIQLEDEEFADFYAGSYFPTWLDDELNKLYELTQPIVDRLRPRFHEWKVEPAVKGPFSNSPNWWQSGDIQYLVAANFEDPSYNHTVKQTMARPNRMPLDVRRTRGAVAYDLLAKTQLPLVPVEPGWHRVEADMTRLQGAILAFLPKAVAGMRLHHQRAEDGGVLRLSAELYQAGGDVIGGLFPCKVTLAAADGRVISEYYRTLGAERRVDIVLPANPGGLRCEVRELISGQQCDISLAPLPVQPALATAPKGDVFVPYPAEVAAFLQKLKQVKILYGTLEGAKEAAAALAGTLEQKGIKATVAFEMDAYQVPLGDPDAIDPMNDGYHHWRKNVGLMQPTTIVDAPVILLGGTHSSYVLKGLADYGFVTHLPVGKPGVWAQPSIQLARRGLNWQHDTLCLLANDAEGLALLAKHLFAERSVQTPALAFASVVTVDSKQAERTMPAQVFGGTNEMVLDVQRDGAGNSYAITWGHGKNLYSFTPSGQLRFAKHLPEMGANRLDVLADRLIVHTAAGGRVYQMTLSGEPISQVRLQMDPGDTYYSDGYQLNRKTDYYQYLPGKERLLYHNHGGGNDSSMRVVDDGGNIVAEWYGESYRDQDVDDKERHRELHSFTLSPNGQHVAQIETTKYFTADGTYKDRVVYESNLVLRDLNGKLLAQYESVANDEIARVIWADEQGPAVITARETWQFDRNLKHLFTHARPPVFLELGPAMTFVRDGHSLRRVDHQGREHARFGPFDVLPSVAAKSPNDQLVAFGDEYARVFVYDMNSGDERGRFRLPEQARALLVADDGSLLVGTLRGAVIQYAADGQERWRQRLEVFNGKLDEPARLYAPEFPDQTTRLWPASEDNFGELDAMVRMTDSRLANGQCEKNEGWQGQAVRYRAEGRSGRALHVGAELVGQTVEGYIGDHSSWVLEFFYRAADSQASLLAGVQVRNRYGASVARTLMATKAWKFGRVVVKTGENAAALNIGFLAKQGDVLLDDLTLRRIRFPSVNHLLGKAIHDVEPVVLANPWFAKTYDPLGRKRESLVNRVFVGGPKNNSGPEAVLVEPAFMQNGRLNDLDKRWYVQPLSQRYTQIAAGLEQPRWVSMVALYFNTHDPENVAPHFDIYVTDVASKEQRLVASVRHNRQLFRLVKFKPVKTPEITIRLVKAIKRLRTLTEIEVYGPLSGQEGAVGFADANGQNTYMGGFARVDRREVPVAPKYDVYATRQIHHEPFDVLWGAPTSQVMVSEGRYYFSEALGFNSSFQIEQPKERLTRERAGALGYGPNVTLYAGLLLKPGLDGKLYCIDAESSRPLWTADIGERLTSCPVVIEEDVFVASDTGKLFKLDLANGSVLFEQDLPGGVAGALATDGKGIYAICDNGQLCHYGTRFGKLRWTVDVAPYTESTPAIDAGMIYLADQKGVAYAIKADTGKVTWKGELGAEFLRCPVVLKDAVAFGCYGGDLVVLNRNTGKPRWRKQVTSSFDYEPLPCGDRLLYVDGLKLTTAALADGKTVDLGIALKDEPMVSMSHYQGRIFIVTRHFNNGHTAMNTNAPWHVRGGLYYLLTPAPKEEDKKAQVTGRKTKEQG